MNISDQWREAASDFVAAHHEAASVLIGALLAKDRIEDDEFVLSIRLYYRFVAQPDDVLKAVPHEKIQTVLDSQNYGGIRFAREPRYSTREDTEAMRLSDLQKLPDQQTRRDVLTTLRDAVPMAVRQHAESVCLKLD